MEEGQLVSTPMAGTVFSESRSPEDLTVTFFGFFYSENRKRVVRVLLSTGVRSFGSRALLLIGLLILFPTLRGSKQVLSQ